MRRLLLTLVALLVACVAISQERHYHYEYSYSNYYKDNDISSNMNLRSTECEDRIGSIYAVVLNGDGSHFVNLLHNCNWGRLRAVYRFPLIVRDEEISEKVNSYIRARAVRRF